MPVPASREAQTQRGAACRAPAGRPGRGNKFALCFRRAQLRLICSGLGFRPQTDPGPESLSPASAGVQWPEF